MHFLDRKCSYRQNFFIVWGNGLASNKAHVSMHIISRIQRIINRHQTIICTNEDHANLRVSPYVIAIIWILAIFRFDFMYTSDSIWLWICRSWRCYSYYALRKIPEQFKMRKSPNESKDLGHLIFRYSKTHLLCCFLTGINFPKSKPIMISSKMHPSY